MSDEEQKFGLEGIEQAQGFERMPMASPVDVPEPDHMSEHEIAHANRPAESDWGELTEREYYNNQTGEPTPENQTVSKEQASHDLAATRAAERAALEAARNAELDEALRAHEAGQQPTQEPGTDIQPELEVQPEADPSYAQATQDAELEQLLQNPALRERVTAEYQQMASAVEQAKGQYFEAANAVAQQAEALTAVTFPELAPFAGNPQAMAGALQMLAKENPARFAELQTFASRAAQVMEHSQRVQAEQRQAQAMQYQAELDKYTKAEVTRYEQMTANESPETVRTIKENLAPIVEKVYGVPMETLMDIHNGKRFVGATEFVRSAGFQAMLHDAIKFRLAQDGVRQARSNPIPKVMRPGVSESGPRDDGEVSHLQSKFNLNPSRDLGAALIAARRNSR